MTASPAASIRRTVQRVHRHLCPPEPLPEVALGCGGMQYDVQYSLSTATRHYAIGIAEVGRDCVCANCLSETETSNSKYDCSSSDFDPANDWRASVQSGVERKLAVGYNAPEPFNT